MSDMPQPPSMDDLKARERTELSPLLARLYRHFHRLIGDEDLARDAANEAFHTFIHDLTGEAMTLDDIHARENAIVDDDFSIFGTERCDAVMDLARQAVAVHQLLDQADAAPWEDITPGTRLPLLTRVEALLIDAEKGAARSAAPLSKQEAALYDDGIGRLLLWWKHLQDDPDTTISGSAAHEVVGVLSNLSIVRELREHRQGSAVESE